MGARCSSDARASILLLVIVADLSACDADEAGVGSSAREALTSAIQGYVTTASDDPYVNRCAVDPLGDLNALADDPAYVLAYSSGRSGCGAVTPAPADGS